MTERQVHLLRIMADPVNRADRLGSRDREAIRAILDEWAELLDELKRVEWRLVEDHHFLQGKMRWRYCPCCEGIHRDDEGAGHERDCTLAAAIAKAEGVTEAPR